MVISLPRSTEEGYKRLVQLFGGLCGPLKNNRANVLGMKQVK